MKNARVTPTEVAYIENHWQHLQPHVREAIMTLVDGALTAGLVESEAECATQSADARLDAVHAETANQ